MSPAAPSRAAWVAVVAALGCAGPSPERDAGPGASDAVDGWLAVAVRDAEAVHRIEPAALERALARLAERRAAAPAPRSAAEAAARRAEAELARAAAHRLGDTARLDLARRLLEDVAAGEGVEACLAALDLARLEARDAVDLASAHRLAAAAASRFADTGTPECLDGLSWLLAVTEPDRPPPDALEASLAQGDDLAAPAEPDELVAGPGRLERVAVFGPAGALERSRVGSVRLMVELDRPVALAHGAVAADDPLPPRVYLDLACDSVAPEVPDLLAVDAGGLRRVRVAAHAPGVVRVVLDLEPGAGHRVVRLPGDTRAWVDVFVDARAPGRAPRLVVLDPGHGGDDHGAQFGGLEEADVALDLALRTARHLERGDGGFRALLTRRDDVAVELEARTAFANAVRADLFVSIHLNAADEPVQRGGVTTFVLDTTEDAQAIRLAARENGTSPARVTRLQHLLARLHRADQVAASRALAEAVQASLLARGRAFLPGLADRGVKAAAFHVLVGARMPAVLVEASFLTHPDDARALADSGYREALARGLAEGIRRHGGAL